MRRRNVLSQRTGGPWTSNARGCRGRSWTNSEHYGRTTGGESSRWQRKNYQRRKNLPMSPRCIPNVFGAFAVGKRRICPCYATVRRLGISICIKLSKHRTSFRRWPTDYCSRVVCSRTLICIYGDWNQIKKRERETEREKRKNKSYCHNHTKLNIYLFLC